jgi:hypothetical protein
LATEDLVTHAVIVGMTGSGKTGLGVGLIEETLAAGVPTLLIDPKGDLTNLTLVFPDLAAADFEPWVDPAQAKNAGMTTADFAAGQAALWRDGLSKWGIGPAELRVYKDSHEVVIYTPGSTAGVPLNVLGSLAAPGTDDPEVINDEVEGYVTGLLSLVGIDADPLASREHILLSNLISAAWQAGETIDLATLLARVQQPPMRKLGVFELDQFFPPKDRMAFAIRLNGVLAAPTFATWMTGDPIDIDRMLFTESGQPRCAVVTTAHLSDEERLSATSMVLSKLITWMRRQSGTTDLRVMLYLDEVAGYLPPTANPPTKKPLMLLMKQARAFGVGLVLSTQNPVDIDYKALSNAGTWFVGRLSTDQDRARLIDGMANSASGVDPHAIADTIAGLGKRQFVLRKAGGDVAVFGTKWARSYLRGPMTRAQIAVVRVVSTAEPAAAESATPLDEGSPADAPPNPLVAAPSATGLADDETQVMPKVAEGTEVFFIDPAAQWLSQVGAAPQAASNQRLVAAAVARVVLRYDDARAGIVHDDEYEAVIVPLPASTASLAPTVVDYDDRDLIRQSPPAAHFAMPLAKIDAKTYWNTMRRDLTDFLVHSARLEVFANPELKAYSRVGESQEQFTARCATLAQGQADLKVAALKTKYDAKLRTLRSRLDAAEGKAEAAQAARTTGMMSEVGSVLGGFLGGRKSSSAITAAAKRAQNAHSRAKAAEFKVGEISQQVADLEAELIAEVSQIEAEWGAKAANVVPAAVPAKRTNVRVTDLHLVWLPVGN